MFHVRVPVLSENMNYTYPNSSIKSLFHTSEYYFVSQSLNSSSFEISLPKNSLSTSIITYRDIGIMWEYATQ